MSWVVCEVDDLKEAGTEATEHRELEGVLFRDENGNEKRYKIKAMIPQSTSYMRSLYPDTDWDETCPHVAILLGEEIKSK